MGHRRQCGANIIKQSSDILVGVAHGLFNLAAIITGYVIHFQNTVDKHAQAKLRWHTPRAGVRTVEQAEVFEVLHHIAHGCRANLFRKRAGEGA